MTLLLRQGIDIDLLLRLMAGKIPIKKDSTFWEPEKETKLSGYQRNENHRSSFGGKLKS
jgi:hypothetical protein